MTSPKIIGTVVFASGSKQYEYDYDDVNDILWSEKSKGDSFFDETFWMEEFENDGQRFEQRMEDMVLGLVRDDPDQTDIEELGDVKDWSYEICDGKSWADFLPK